jgi:hypothetical protein
MASGWAGDGAVQDQIDATIKDGVSLCVKCQEEEDREEAAFAGYNRRGSKDSQLR